MRESLLNILRTALICASVISLLSGCRTFGGVSVNWPPDDPPPHHKEKKGPPPHAPAHGYRAKHMYHYYPASHVYFDVDRGVYFHLEGSTWHVGASLPRHIHADLDGYVKVEVEGDKPYVDYNKHMKKYPPGQYKKKKKKKKKKKWD